MANPDRTATTMTHWTGECEVESMQGTVGTNDQCAVDVTFAFSLTNITKRCGFQYHYTIEFYKATAFWPNGEVKTWTPQGDLRVHLNKSDTVPKNGVRTQDDYIEEGGGFDNIQSQYWDGGDWLWKVEAYVTVDPARTEYGRTLKAQDSTLVDAR